MKTTRMGDISHKAAKRAVIRKTHLMFFRVQAALRNIFRKTGVANRTEAVNYARRADLLERG